MAGITGIRPSAGFYVVLRMELLANLPTKLAAQAVLKLTVVIPSQRLKS